MKKFIILFIVFAFAIFHLSAQTKREKIKEFFHLMNTDSLTSSMLENMNRIRSTITPINKQRDSLYNDFVKAEVKTMISKMNDTYMVEAYDKYFTIQEIQKYIDFYQSPEGKKMMIVAPVIQKEMMTLMAKEYMPELQAEFKKKLEKLNN